MGRKTKAVKLTLDEEVFLRLQAIADKEGRSLANLLRRIVQKSARVDRQPSASAK